MNIAEEVAKYAYRLVHGCVDFLVQNLERGYLITADGSKYNPAKGYKFDDLMDCYLVDPNNKDVQTELPNVVMEWTCWQLGKKNFKTFHPEQTQELVIKLMNDNSNQNLVFMYFNLVFESFHKEAVSKTVVD